MESEGFTLKTNNHDSSNQNKSMMNVDDEEEEDGETEPLHDQSALNFSLRLSDEEADTIDR